jgi:Zn ribbon nucleic-acid-binding protein|tara:strand:- start:173 stop:745 length:573 start_codon:yes stop_codon:yes gene_type:complete
MPENKKSKVVEDKVIRKNVTYLKCPKCKMKEGLIHDERDNEELFEFCMRCGYSQRNLDIEGKRVNEVVDQGQGTFRYSLITEKNGYHMGPLIKSDLTNFETFVNTNRNGLTMATVTIRENRKWVIVNYFGGEKGFDKISNKYAREIDFMHDDKNTQLYAKPIMTAVNRKQRRELKKTIAKNIKRDAKRKK